MKIVCFSILHPKMDYLVLMMYKINYKLLNDDYFLSFGFGIGIFIGFFLAMIFSFNCYAEIYRRSASPISISLRHSLAICDWAFSFCLSSPHLKALQELNNF